MTTLWNRISRVIARWTGRLAPGCRPSEPRLICCCEVIWESQGRRGEGQLREVSSTSLRLFTDHAVLVGRPIRILPKPSDAVDPLPLDIAMGTVAYSRSRRGRIEIGVRLTSPERFSRYSWLYQLRREPELPRLVATAPVPSRIPRLTVVGVNDSHRPN